MRRNFEDADMANNRDKEASKGGGDEMQKSLSRRRLLQRAGTGVAAGILATAAGKSGAEESQRDKRQSDQRAAPVNISGRTPIALIIDDGSPVDPLFYELPGYETPFLVPHEFTRRVVETFERFDIRGKFTVIPMPSCLGRIDQSLKRVPPDHLAGWLKLVREGIAPRLDITPEFLTHMQAYKLKGGGFQHIYEDVWISGAPQEEIVEYFVLAFEILKNVGLPATGITSPWVSGIDVEKKYAQALAEAQWKVFSRKLTWYFLHCTTWDAPRKCSVEYEDPGRGQVVVSVPANTGDIFWSMEQPREERPAFVQRGIDRLISADGRTGRIRELMESDYPVVLVTHWQSLYTQGTGLGLEGLATLAERIQKVFGNSLEWVTCSELARRYVASTKPNG
jgi:hypothetical protein